MNRELDRWQRREIAQWRDDMRRVGESRARRAWGERPEGGWLGALAEWAAGLATLALIALLAWLYMVATPDQASAEADWAAEEARAAEEAD